MDPIYTHSHNGSDSKRLRPDEALEGFTLYTTIPTHEARQGTFALIYQAVPTAPATANWRIYAYLPNNSGSMGWRDLTTG
jgi:hypothetical protein